MNGKRFGDVRIERLSPMRVACYRKISNSPELEAAAFLQAWLSAQGVTGPVRQFGFDTEVTQDESNAGLRGYDVWLTVPASVAASPEVTLQDFEGGAYAVMKIDNPFEDPFHWIPSGWKALHEWVSNNERYQAAEHQFLEEIVREGDIEHLVLYYPIQPRLLP